MDINLPIDNIIRKVKKLTRSIARRKDCKKARKLCLPYSFNLYMSVITARKWKIYTVSIIYRFTELKKQKAEEQGKGFLKALIHSVKGFLKTSKETIIHNIILKYYTANKSNKHSRQTQREKIVAMISHFVLTTLHKTEWDSGLLPKQIFDKNI